MIGQQRNILATLGIDIWIPRTQVCQKNNAHTVWRDQIVESHTPIIAPTIDVPAFEQKPSKPLLPEAPKVVEQPSIAIRDDVPQSERIVEKPVIAVEQEAITPFELQAYCLEKCVIFVDVTALEKEEKQLWTNIQKVKVGHYAELKWPFPLGAYQDQRGVGSYIQGFLDAVAAEKKILCLGKCAYIQHANIIHLASLKEMLDKPLLKKRLWQLMQDNNE
ncbi:MULTISPECIES: hypothetical protein [Acinetobacter]|uniref:Uncharacterized protein n=1 Tax=Acinetobacter baumannii TaxID=470 RepID=A0AAP1FDR5_ACIBA|nr:MULTISPECIES: hypothetical protein [Acinetobacter]AIL78451.1 hypothetical protein IX87_07360 [Acinetobacter baumannii]AIS07112.1 hypothetical protein LX00_12185 [Acinetobacter baumannii]ATD21906.1 hypothetical protein BS098_19190 [Acinetobacter baumannii]AVE55961.1 hypothetical protein AM442_15830 [Acinetobacter baumannii]AVO93067.1 hypothetical protein AM480_20475 [Acinetobacter baumannii]